MASAPAADLDEAARFADRNVQNALIVGTSLRTLMDAWVAGLLSNLEDNVAEGTVRDWAVIGQQEATSTPAAAVDQSQADANRLSTYLFRSCQAAQYAEANGRISAGTATALVNLYNTVWT